MEFTFLASYTVILLGFLIMDNPEYQQIVRHFLKRQHFEDMVVILKKFFNFMSLTASVSIQFYFSVELISKLTLVIHSLWPLTFVNKTEHIF